MVSLRYGNSYTIYFSNLFDLFISVTGTSLRKNLRQFEGFCRFLIFEAIGKIHRSDLKVLSFRFSLGIRT